MAFVYAFVLLSVISFFDVNFLFLFLPLLFWINAFSLIKFGENSLAKKLYDKVPKRK
jgi:hypothetical protein